MPLLFSQSYWQGDPIIASVWVTRLCSRWSSSGWGLRVHHRGGDELKLLVVKAWEGSKEQGRKHISCILSWEKTKKATWIIWLIEVSFLPNEATSISFSVVSTLCVENAAICMGHY
ncbi:uncharacterized protein LOC124686550 isoform X2 [Lolium rigidum]|uniref:uncharacterized protein LOC124686550 isoform X2 n=1 Tax=Lolium rigidum TaxID=89674 RepID=UPI001F5CFC36|nr:uncharacterized protein LOC124686550 isoform X2 [Lolium rigidum]